MFCASSLWCPLVLTETGWRENVRIDINPQGGIAGLSPDTAVHTLQDDVMRVDGALVPAIPNLHSHAHQRAMAGLAERSGGKKDSFWTWREAMYRMLERLVPEQLYAIARMLYLEMLEAGYTHVAEFQYLHHDPSGNPYSCRAEMTLQCARAASDVGIGFTAVPVLYRYAGFGAEPAGPGQLRFVNDADEFLEIFSAVAASLGSNQIVGMAPHSLRAVDAALLQYVLGAVPAGIPIHLHIAEQIREVDDCVAWSGMRPVEWLFRHFEPNEHWCLIHATHVTPEEVVQLARSGAVVGLCPTTEGNLGDGVFPAVDYLARGGRFGIGSDSHISISPVEELRWLEYGQRLVRQERNCLAPPDGAGGHTGEALLIAAASGGTRACGYSGGSIASGMRADLISLDTGHPRLYGRTGGELSDSWVFSGNDCAIKQVFVAGKPVLQEGRHPDRETVINQFRKTIDQLVS